MTYRILLLALLALASCAAPPSPVIVLDDAGVHKVRGGPQTLPVGFLARPDAGTHATVVVEAVDGGTPAWATLPAGITSVVGTSPVACSGSPTATCSLGTVPIANGGTGLVNAGTVDGGVLTSNGTAFSYKAPASGVPTGTQSQYLEYNGSAVPTPYTMGGDCTSALGVVECDKLASSTISVASTVGNLTCSSTATGCGLSQASTTTSPGANSTWAPQPCVTTSPCTSGDAIVKLTAPVGAGTEAGFVIERGTTPVFRAGSFPGYPNSTSLWIGATPATTPTTANWSVYADGSIIQYNAPTEIYFGIANAFPVTLTGTTFTLGSTTTTLNGTTTNLSATTTVTTSANAAWQSSAGNGVNAWYTDVTTTSTAANTATSFAIPSGYGGDVTVVVVGNVGGLRRRETWTGAVDNVGGTCNVMTTGGTFAISGTAAYDGSPMTTATISVGLSSCNVVATITPGSATSTKWHTVLQLVGAQ